MFQSTIECAVRDAQLLCGFAAIAVIALERLFEHLLADGVQVQAFGLFLGFDIFFGEGILSRSDGRDGRHGRDRCQLGAVGDGSSDSLSAALHVFELFLEQTDLTPHIVHVASEFEEYLVEYLALILKRVVATVLMNGHELSRLLILWYEVAEHIGSDGALG